MNEISIGFIIAVLSAGIRLASPVVFAALGGIVCEKSGVINIGLEGFMVIGAFTGFLGSLWTGSVWGGILLSVLFGGLTGLLFAFLTVTLKADQIVIGMAINIFAVGATSFFYRIITGQAELGLVTQVAMFENVEIPLIAQIPVLGQIISGHKPLVYFSYLAIPLVGWAMRRTNWGLELRSVGEHPLAAETAGVNVFKTRYQALAICGILASLGGVCLSIGQIAVFNEWLVGGRGFIALAAVIFGGWVPYRASIAALLFGVIEAIQLRLQNFGAGVSTQILYMLPYLLTLVAFVLLVRKSTPPAAAGKPFPEE